MTKAQANQFQTIVEHLRAGNRDTAARSLSAMIRSATVGATKQTLYRFAVQNSLQANPNFIL